MISPESWGDNYVSKHHYAETLVELGNVVFFLNTPGKVFHWQITEGGVNVIDYKPIFYGLGKLPAWLSSLLILYEFKHLERRLKTHFDIIWNFDSSRFFNLSRIPGRTYKICHLVDLNQNIQRPLLAATSDICLGTTRYIVDKLCENNRNSHLVGHAYRPQKNSGLFEFDVPGVNSVKAFYLGNLSMKYIDWEILLEAANEHTGIDFVFIGPEGKSNLTEGEIESASKKQIKMLPNVFFCPPVHAHHIPQLLKKADLLLIAYQEKYHKDQASPHKMLEYLASGKTIIATYTEEFESYRNKSRLVMCIRNAEFPKAIATALTLSSSEYKMDLPSYRDRIQDIERLLPD